MLHRHGRFGRDDACAENLCACDGSRAENQSKNRTNVSEEAGLHSFQRIVACHVGRSRDIFHFRRCQNAQRFIDGSQNDKKGAFVARLESR